MKWRLDGELNPDHQRDKLVSWPLNDRAVVLAPGFEPGTSCLSGRRANRIAPDEEDVEPRARFELATGGLRNRCSGRTELPRRWCSRDDSNVRPARCERAALPLSHASEVGLSETIRTSDLRLRKPALCSTELRRGDGGPGKGRTFAFSMSRRCACRYATRPRRW